MAVVAADPSAPRTMPGVHDLVTEPNSAGTHVTFDVDVTVDAAGRGSSDTAAGRHALADGADSRAGAR